MGVWIALFGTSVLTVSYWHLHFSRLGFGVVPLAFASTAAAAALLWAMKSYDAGSLAERRRNMWSWCAAGALLGLIPYTYFAFPTFLAAIGAATVLFFVLQKESFKRKLLPLSLLALGAAVSAAPVIQFALRSPEAYFGRMNQKSVWDYHEFADAAGFAEKAGFLAERAWEAASLLLRNPRVDGVDGIGGVGAMDAGFAILAYFGLIVSVRKWRSPPHFMAALVVIAALSGLVLTESFGRFDATQYHRHPLGFRFGRGRRRGDHSIWAQSSGELGTGCGGERVNPCTPGEHRLESQLLFHRIADDFNVSVDIPHLLTLSPLTRPTRLTTPVQFTISRSSADSGMRRSGSFTRTALGSTGPGNSASSIWRNWIRGQLPTCWRARTLKRSTRSWRCIREGN